MIRVICCRMNKTNEMATKNFSTLEFISVCNRLEKFNAMQKLDGINEQFSVMLHY